MSADIGFGVTVPANVSRYFHSREEAKSQPAAKVQLAWDSSDPWIFNRAFDASLVRHDGYYCTGSMCIDGSLAIPTSSYFPDLVAPFLDSASNVVDIGCGQGEFVGWVRSMGIPAVGYDPVLRKQAAGLFPRYWSPDEAAADLYVMRCVLPHIEDPWTFLASIASSSPGSLVLIEYQRLDFILAQNAWFQISHDHVNQFRLSDFTERFDVKAHGVFAGDEWQWVLLSPKRVGHPPDRPFDLEDEFVGLWASRERSLDRWATLDQPLAIWGAAGKGAAIAHALVEAGIEQLIAIDADPDKSGMFMEGSGVEVFSPASSLDYMKQGTQMIVANPNHLTDVRDYVAGRFLVTAASAWGAAADIVS